MIISNGTTNSNHHAVMDRNNSGSVLTANTSTNNTTYHHRHPEANTNHNIGVVSPLIYNNPSNYNHHHDPNNYTSAAPPLSATALRTVSSCSSIGFGHNPISPTTTTQRMEDVTTTTNYSWSASSLNRSSISDHLHPYHSNNNISHINRPTLLRPTRASFPDTTTTPKHERHLPPDSHDAPSTTLLTQSSSTHKKQRPNSYIAPRHIPDTYTSRVGTNQHSGSNSSSSSSSSSSLLMPPHSTNRVAFRRQLSSGKIEAFLSGSTTTTMDAGLNNSNSNSSIMMDVDAHSGHNNNCNNNKMMDASSQQQQQQQQRPRSMSF